MAWTCVLNDHGGGGSGMGVGPGETLGCSEGPPRQQADFIFSQWVKIRQGSTLRENINPKAETPTAPSPCQTKQTCRAEGLSHSQSYFDLWSGSVCAIHFYSWVSFLLSYFHYDFLLFCKELILQNWGQEDQEKLVEVIIPVRKLRVQVMSKEPRVSFTPFNTGLPNHHSFLLPRELIALSLGFIVLVHNNTVTAVTVGECLFCSRHRLDIH